MAHGITAQDRVGYSTGTPWHGLGIEVGAALTGDAMLEATGLTWAVEKRATYVRRPDGTDAATGYYATVRTDTDAVLGNVSAGYTVVQRAALVEFMDSLVQDGQMRYDVVGTLFGGKREWLLAVMDEDYRIGDEPWKRYLLGLNSYDGSTGVVIKSVNERAVCANTIAMGLSEVGISSKIYHTGNVSARMADAAKVLEINTASGRRLKEMLERAMLTAAPAGMVDETVEDIFGKAEDFGGYTNGWKMRWEQNVERFRAEFLATEVGLNGQTVYSVLQATTGWVDHAMRYTGDNKADRRFSSSLLGGRGMLIKGNAMARVKELVA